MHFGRECQIIIVGPTDESRSLWANIGTSTHLIGLGRARDSTTVLLTSIHVRAQISQLAAVAMRVITERNVMLGRTERRGGEIGCILAHAASSGRWLELEL